MMSLFVIAVNLLYIDKFTRLFNAINVYREIFTYENINIYITLNSLVLADACESNEWAWILSSVGSREIRQNQNAQVSSLDISRLYIHVYLCTIDKVSS